MPPDSPENLHVIENAVHLETRSPGVYLAVVAPIWSPAHLASLLPGLLPSVPSARLQFSCVLQPKWFSFSE